MVNYSKYSKYYADDKFTTLARMAGNKLPFIENAIAMYYCLKDSNTPLHVKLMITGALGYFILPVDVVPDFIPLAGRLDDAGVVAAVLAIISTYIKPEHKRDTGDFIDIEPIRDNNGQ